MDYIGVVLTQFGDVGVVLTPCGDVVTVIVVVQVPWNTWSKMHEFSQIQHYSELRACPSRGALVNGVG